MPVPTVSQAIDGCVTQEDTLPNPLCPHCELVAQNQPAGKSRGVVPVPSRILPEVDAPTPCSVNSSLAEGEQLTLSAPEAVLRLTEGMERADFLP